MRDQRADITVDGVEVYRARLQYAQLAENAKVARSSILGNVANMALTAGLVWYTALSSILPIFLLLFVIGIVLVWRGMHAHKVNNLPEDAIGLDRHCHELVMISGALGTAWGLISALMLVYGTTIVAIFAGILGSGMINAGAMSFRTRSDAAKTYILGCAAASGAGLIAVWQPQTIAGFAMLLCYIAVVFSNVRANQYRFDEARMRQFKLEESSETIRILLNDFTEHGSDMLMEVDRSARLINPSQKLADFFQRPKESLDQMPFGDLLPDCVERRQLKAAFLSASVINHHVIPLEIAGQRRWISINGRPFKSGAISYRGIVSDITSQKFAEERVAYLAHFDALTDLPNRVYFTDRLTAAMSKKHAQVGLLYLDLDHFKMINDTLGHAVGDELLAYVARCLEKICGKDAVIARFGGDEFAIALRKSSAEKAADIAAKIVDGLSRPITLKHHDVVIGASIGVALAPHDATTSDELIRKADLALYAAKNEGRSCYCHFEADMDKAAQQRRAIEMELREALGSGQLLLHYQPVVDIQSSEVRSYEALIRWQHPERGTIMPGIFIPIAEETGMIVAIGEWVIRQALDDLAKWPSDISVAINLSPIQLRSPTLLSTLLNALAHSDVSPDRICLEITETVFMQDSEANIETMYKIRDMGLKIALDDFGTGYSSLNYLRSFPFDKIKIDRCFISEIDKRDDCRAIVRSVVSLAKSLGVETIAEGVERAEQLEIVRQEGCSEAQGYYFDKAAPQEELTDLRRKSAPIVAERKQITPDKVSEDAWDEAHSFPIRAAAGS